MRHGLQEPENDTTAFCRPDRGWASRTSQTNPLVPGLHPGLFSVAPTGSGLYIRQGTDVGAAPPRRNNQEGIDQDKSRAGTACDYHAANAKAWESRTETKDPTLAGVRKDEAPSKPSLGARLAGTACRAPYGYNDLVQAGTIAYIKSGCMRHPRPRQMRAGRRCYKSRREHCAKRILRCAQE
jgi:hypothetical protein